MTGYVVSSRTSDFLQEHMFCCLCGGTVLATQKEHTPSTQFFSGKWRPQQIVVPACANCNQATGPSDQLIAVLARLYDRKPHPNEGDTLQKAIYGVHRSLPDVASELVDVSARQRRKAFEISTQIDEEVYCLNFGDRTQIHFQAFGAKLALALFYWETRRIIPAAGGATVQIWSWADRLRGPILPNEFADILGPEQSLKQGRKNLSDQFSYSSALADNGNAAIFFVTLGRTFALALSVAVNDDFFSDARHLGVFVHRPGFFFHYRNLRTIGSIKFAFNMRKN